MWQDTRVTRDLGIRYPIIQGPFGGGFSSPDLVAAVSNAGGLGSFGAHNLSGEAILATARDIRARTDKPFAMNLWVSVADMGGYGLDETGYRRALTMFDPYYQALGIGAPTTPEGRHIEPYEEQVDALLEARPAVFSFVFGIPSKYVLARCREAGIKTLGAATTVAEAKALQDAGVDMVLATGLEAGGHRPSFIDQAEDSLVGTLPLVPQVRDATDIPLIAAGGIGDARGIAAAFALGADAVQLGTAFLACAESNTTDKHRDWIFKSRAEETVLSRAFTGRLARFRRNRFTQSMTNPLPFPLQAWFTGVMKRAALESGDDDLASLYAGQGAPLLRHRTAADLMSALINGLDAFYSQPQTT